MIAAAESTQSCENEMKIVQEADHHLAVSSTAVVPSSPSLEELYHVPGVLSDIRVIYRHSRRQSMAPRYRHLTPRAPAAAIEAVLNRSSVRRVISELATERGVRNRTVLNEARGMLGALGHDMNAGAVRVLGYAVRKIVNTLYTEVRFDSIQLKRLAAELAMNPVLLLPTHRSYMDFIILSYAFLCCDMPLPVIAAGEDFQKMAVVGAMLQGCGAFFIRRSFGSDRLYWALLSGYVDEIVCNGAGPLEFFVEGTRSRTGKSLHPKTGLLALAARPWFQRRCGDIAAVPISITYTQRLESHLYVDEMLGTPKPRESLAGLIRARSILTHNYGAIHVAIGSPISLSRFCAARGADTRQLGTRSPGPHPMRDPERRVVVDLGYAVLSSLERNLVITCPALAAALLVSHGQAGRTSIDVRQLSDEIFWLGAHATARGHTVSLPENGASGVAAALRALEPACTVHERQVEMMLDSDFNAIYLAHYRNEVTHVWLLPALRALALRIAGVQEPAVAYTFLRGLLSREFVLRACTEEEARQEYEQAAVVIAAANCDQGQGRKEEAHACGGPLVVAPGGLVDMRRLMDSLLLPFLVAVSAVVGCLRHRCAQGTGTDPVSRKKLAADARIVLAEHCAACKTTSAPTMVVGVAPSVLHELASSAPTENAVASLVEVGVLKAANSKKEVLVQ